VEDEEALKTSALVSQLTNAVENQVDNFLADGVMTTCVIVGSILLSGDELFGMEQLTVSASADLIDYGWLEIDEDSPWDVFTGSGLTEEGVEGVISTSNGLVTGHLSIRLDSVFQAVELPAGITDLDTSLSDMDGDALTHDEELPLLVFTS